MRIRRLGWAGIELQLDGRAAVIDLLQDLGRMTHFIGESREPLPGPAAAGEVDLALVTHLHEDHCDVPALTAALGPDGVLLRPEASRGSALAVAGTALPEGALADGALASRIVAPWETFDHAGFRATAVPAVDGFGDPQVSWVVEGARRRILHAGDTLYHGSWWTIRERLGPFDVVFLPVNGAVCDLPHRQPASSQPATLTPAQAAAAARLLGAELAVPIHYGAIHHPPTYCEADEPAAAFVAEAAALGVQTRVLAPGELLP